MESTKETIKRLLAECLEVPPEEIDDEMPFNGELEFDSFEIVKFVISLEETYQIEFDDFSELTHHMDHVGALICYLEGYLMEVRQT